VELSHLMQPLYLILSWYRLNKDYINHKKGHSIECPFFILFLTDESARVNLLEFPKSTVQHMRSNSFILATSRSPSSYHTKIKYHRSRSTILRLSILRIERSRSFDWVIANHVLEHVQHENIAFQELHRVLKARGSIIIQVPFTNHLEFTRSSDPNWTEDDSKEQLGQYDHQRLYGLDFMRKVTNFGFVFKPADIKESTALNYRINPDEKIFLFEKQNNHP
jgi:SAM-dependent methyltransferase